MDILLQFQLDPVLYAVNIVDSFNQYKQSRTFCINALFASMEYSKIIIYLLLIMQIHFHVQCIKDQ